MSYNSERELTLRIYICESYDVGPVHAASSNTDVYSLLSATRETVGAHIDIMLHGSSTCARSRIIKKTRKLP